MDNQREFSYEITEHIGVIKKYPNGWQKELNLVSWNSATPKLDIRDWNEDHDRMSRGLTLLPEEMAVITELMASRV